MKRNLGSRPFVLLDEKGLIRQGGLLSEYEQHSTTRIEELLDSVESFAAMLAACGLKFERNASLLRMKHDAQRLRSAQAEGGREEVSWVRSAVSLHCIVEATKNCTSNETTAKKLKSLMDGSLDMGTARRSLAKDTYWEFELRNILRSGGVEVDFEEPDLMITSTSPFLSVACKKIYSRKNVRKVVSDAVGQIERRGGVGIVALNLDDLEPCSELRTVASLHTARRRMQRKNDFFGSDFNALYKRYLRVDRAEAVLMSSGGVFDILDFRPRVNLLRQTSIFAVPASGGGERDVIRQLRLALLAANS